MDTCLRYKGEAQLVGKPEDNFMKINKMKVRLGETSAKISMDDLYVINTVRSLMTKEGEDIAKIWSDYSE